MFPGPVCVVLTPSKVSEVYSADLTGADCVEVRLDYLLDPRESRGVNWRDLPRPVIATCRSVDRGGRFAGSPDDEVGLLEEAVRGGARYVDLDYRFARPVGDADVIASFHDFEGTPQDLPGVMGAICSGAGSVAKLAVMTRTWGDVRRVLELAERRWPKPVIAVGMGAIGQMTRVVGPTRGSQLTYVSSGQESAPGQVSVSELLDTYRFSALGRETRVLGIVGNPVAHSDSPRLHNRAMRAAGLDYVYLRFPVESLADFFEHASALGVVGFSVTIPHKVEVVRFLDRLTREAEAVGAVNTVSRENGEWVGHNTDVYGIRESLRDLDLAGRRVVILGTGGAARAAVAALPEAGSVTLLSRGRPAGSATWAREVRIDRLDRYPEYDADLLINATPVGMSPDSDQMPVSPPLRAEAVFDMVYNPEHTRLLDAARDQGKQTISGLTMFLAQAARQFEIWTGQHADATIFSGVSS